MLQVRFKACKFWNENENMRILFKWVAKSKDSSIRSTLLDRYSCFAPNPKKKKMKKKCRYELSKDIKNFKQSQIWLFRVLQLKKTRTQ